MSNEKFIPEIRRSKIVDYLSTRKKVTLNEISKEFNISHITARRDFNILSEEGFIRKIYGGIELRNNISVEPELFTRMNKNVEEKERIAKEASKRINDGDTILIESGTTCLELLKNLKDKKRLNVITAAPHILNSLCNLKRNGTFEGELYCCGGIWRGDPDDIFVGPQAESFFNHIKITIAFFGIFSISLKDGWTVSSYYESELTKKIIEASDKVIGIAHNSKFEKSSLIKIGKIDLFDEIITNTGLNESLLSQYQLKTKIVIV